MKQYTVNVFEENECHPTGTIYWLDEANQFHCEHGPAMIYPDGRSWYFWHGRHFSKEGWEEMVEEFKQHTIEIDGKKIVVSHESYESIKKGLK